MCPLRILSECNFQTLCSMYRILSECNIQISCSMYRILSICNIVQHTICCFQMLSISNDQICIIGHLRTISEYNVQRLLSDCNVQILCSIYGILSMCNVWEYFWNTQFLQNLPFVNTFKKYRFGTPSSCHSRILSKNYVVWEYFQKYRFETPSFCHSRILSKKI